MIANIQVIDANITVQNFLKLEISVWINKIYKNSTVNVILNSKKLKAFSLRKDKDISSHYSFPTSYWKY